MAERTVYIVGLNKEYITNKTNVTRLWEVVERELGTEDLFMSYRVDQDDKEYVTIPARHHKVKKICQTCYRNRILIHVGEMLDRDDNIVSIIQDIIAGRD
jgi:hypothetical protein